MNTILLVPPQSPERAGDQETYDWAANHTKLYKIVTNKLKKMRSYEETNFNYFLRFCTYIDIFTIVTNHTLKKFLKHSRLATVRSASRHKRSKYIHLHIYHTLIHLLGTSHVLCDENLNTAPLAGPFIGKFSENC